MKPEEFGEFAGSIDNNHRESSSVLLKVDVNGAPDESNGTTNIISARFVYAESPEDLVDGYLHGIRFWMYRDEAVRFASAILDAATDGGKMNVVTPVEYKEPLD